MNTLLGYERQRDRIETYFDRTALAAWARLTSDAPLGRIRASVRAGRDRMRATLLEMLPADLRGRRVLDAGCGAGALAIEAARRGADVLAIDLSVQLIELARSRAPEDLRDGRLRFIAGDMLALQGERFDHVVAMDSLIHYELADMVQMLSTIATFTRESIVFTFAPRTAPLAVMHAIGRLFPRGDRAPAIEPVAQRALVRGLASAPGLSDWACARTTLISHGFYTSQAMELLHT